MGVPRACVEYLIASSEAPQAAGQVINIAAGRRVSLLDVVHTLQRLTGATLEPAFGPPRAGDIRDSQADLTLSREVLNYEPTVNFAEGLRRTFAWYKESQAKANARQKNEE